MICMICMISQTNVLLIQILFFRSIVKAGHREAIVFACIFYSQGTMNSGARDRKEFESTIVVNIKAFSHACTELLTHIRMTPQWIALDGTSSSGDNQFMNSIGRIIYDLLVPDDKKMAVRKTSMAIYDKVSGSPEMNGTLQINMHTACVYAACQALKINIDSDLITCMSSITTIKMMNKIRDVLVRG